MKIVILGGSAAGMSFAAKYKRNQPTDDVIVIENAATFHLVRVACPTLLATSSPIQIA